MAIFAGSDLKKWRSEHNMTAAELAERISCDTTTIYRYESCKLNPNPDVMYEICEVLGDTSRWNDWMRTEYPRSYGRMHPETLQYALPGALLSLFSEMTDVSSIQQEIMRDGADGRINDPLLSDRVKKELTDMIQSAQRVVGLVAQGGK